ncbi:MAG: amidohydrolase family protein [Dermatophilaceae bacterium]
MNRLPDRLLDVHVHANGRAAVGEISAFGWSQPRSTFPGWSVADTRAVERLMFGDRHVDRLWIPQPWLGIDFRQAAAHLLEHRRPGELVALCADLDDPEYTLRELDTGRYAAVKSYPFMREPPYARVADYFPNWLCAAAADAAAPLVLHLARPLDQCLREVVSLLEAHPALHVDLAHLGRVSPNASGVAEAFTVVGASGRVWADTSMVTADAVVELALQHLSPSRVMYGSDAPCNLLRVMPVDDPELGRVNASTHDYHWSSAPGQARYGSASQGVDIVHFQSLAAVLAAVDRLAGPAPTSVLDAVFDANARAFLGLADSDSS